MVFFLYLLGSKGTQKTFFLKGLSNRTAFLQLHHAMPLYAFDPYYRTTHRFSQNHNSDVSECTGLASDAVARPVNKKKFHQTVAEALVTEPVEVSKPPFEKMVRLASTNYISSMFEVVSS